MVAELLARSPEIFAVSSPPRSSAMAAPGMTPGEDFVQSGVAALQTIEVTIGGIMVNITMAVAAAILGPSALMEAKEALAQRFTEFFNGQKKKADLDNIDQDELDGTPDIVTTTTAKQLELDDCQDNDDDYSIVTLRSKINKAKFEALAPTKAPGAEQRAKKISVEEMLEAQRQQYQLFTTKLPDEQKDRHKKEVTEPIEKWKQDKLEMETAIRQRDFELGAIKSKNPDVTTQQTDDPLLHSWLGVSPGLEVMQGKVGGMRKEIPLTANMETPEKSWEDFLEETVNDWVFKLNATARWAPRGCKWFV